jgi:hypothetical protein
VLSTTIIDVEAPGGAPVAKCLKDPTIPWPAWQTARHRG